MKIEDAKCGEDIKLFLSEWNRALSALDMEWAREQLPDTTDRVRRMSLHKARYECTDIDDRLRSASGAWLAGRGMRRVTGGEILPEGVLPE